MSFDCKLCNYRTPSLTLLLSHLRAVHSNDRDINIVCEIDGCGQQYTKCSSYVSRVYRQHHTNVIPVPTQREPGPSTLVSDEMEIDANADETDEDFRQSDVYIDDYTMDQLLGLDDEEQQRMSALFLLGLKEKHCLSQSTVDDIVSSSKDMFKHYNLRMKAGIEERLSRAQIDSNSVPGLDEFLLSASDPFVGLHSTYMQEKYFREKLGCIEPVQKFIGEQYYINQFSGSKLRKVLKRDSFYYVPIADSLKQLVQHPVIIEQIRKPHFSTDGMYRDICDGSLVLDHPQIKTDPNTIIIIAYFDEIEMCNPLASATRKNKLGCIFFSLGNIHPALRSTLKAIFLVAVAESPIIAKHDIDSILQPFVEDIKTLTINGLVFEQHKFSVAVVPFLGDNIDAHLLGGFKGSMSFAKRICHSCMTTKEKAQLYFNENDFELRTPSSHINHLNVLHSDTTGRASIELGINRKSILQDLPNFSVATNLPHDIMHDLFEGVFPYELKHLIVHCLSAKYFTLPMLNKRINNFEYDFREVSDKPIEIDENVLRTADGKIKQSASQMWCLVANFPFLVGDLIPSDDDHYRCFCLLLLISSIATAHEVRVDTVDYLRVLIEEHHSLFKSLYPIITILPKMHYMVHYPNQLYRFGPLISTWTMRYEAKLSVLKRVSRHRNFKNICFTIAKRHQYLLCYCLNIKSLLHLEITHGKCSTGVLITDADKDLRDCITHSIPYIKHHDFVYSTAWVNGEVHLKPNMFVLLRTEGLYPIFGKVDTIYLVGVFCFVKVMVFQTKCFDHIYNAFIVEHADKYEYFCLQALPIHPVYHRRSFDGNNFNTYVSTRMFIELT